MRLVIADLVRRTYRWPAAFLVLGVAMVWSVRMGAGEARTPFSVSLAAAFMVGPLFVAGTPTPRPIWYLPISRRDLWRATWLVATVGPVILTTAAKLLALLVPGATLGFSRLLLSTVYDFAFTGIGCSFFVVSTPSLPAPGLRRHAWDIISTMRIIAFGSCPFWAIAIARRLPTRWSDLSPLTGTMLAAALALTLAAYFHTPSPAARATRRAPRQRARTAMSQAGRGAGLTGLPRLLLHEYAWSAGLGGFLVLTSAATVFVAGALMNSPGSYGGFWRMQGLLLFDGAVAQQRGQLFDLLVWFGLFSATLVSRFEETLRHLRVLPLRASHLNMLFVAWPLLMLLTVWIALLGLHYAVLGQPVQSLQPALFLALAGSSAAMRALSLRWPAYRMFIFGLTISVVPIVRLLNGPSSTLFAVLALGGLAAAATLNHFTLRRSSTYKRPPQGIGVVTGERWA